MLSYSHGANINDDDDDASHSASCFGIHPQNRGAHTPLQTIATEHDSHIIS